MNPEIYKNMNKWRHLASKIYRFFKPIDNATMYKRMGLRLGDNCKIENEVMIDYSHFWLISIGNNVTIAPRVHILAHDASTKKELNYTKLGLVEIQDDVFIGAGTIKNIIQWVNRICKTILINKSY